MSNILKVLMVYGGYIIIVGAIGAVIFIYEYGEIRIIEDSYRSIIKKSNKLFFQGLSPKEFIYTISFRDKGRIPLRIVCSIIYIALMVLLAFPITLMSLFVKFISRLFYKV